MDVILRMFQDLSRETIPLDGKLRFFPNLSRAAPARTFSPVQVSHAAAASAAGDDGALQSRR